MAMAGGRVQGLMVFVVLVLAEAAARQEKIKPKSFNSNSAAPGPRPVFQYSSLFGFDPFTPFPEHQPTTLAPTTTTTSTPPQTTTTLPTTTTRPTTLSPDSSYKTKHEQKKKSLKNTETKSEKDTNIKDWVQSILSRTTRRPEPQRRHSTTSRPPASREVVKSEETFPGNILTKELQSQLRELLKKREMSTMKQVERQTGKQRKSRVHVFHHQTQGPSFVRRLYQKIVSKESKTANQLRQPQYQSVPYQRHSHHRYQQLSQRKLFHHKKLYSPHYLHQQQLSLRQKLPQQSSRKYFHQHAGTFRNYLYGQLK